MRHRALESADYLLTSRPNRHSALVPSAKIGGVTDEDDAYFVMRALCPGCGQLAVRAVVIEGDALVCSCSDCEAVVVPQTTEPPWWSSQRAATSADLTTGGLASMHRFASGIGG